MVHRIPDRSFGRSYLIEEQEGLIVVDVGSIGAAREVENYCTNVLGRPQQDIRLIAVTHFHIDHIGGIGSLLKLCGPETKVIFHPFVRDYISGKRGLSPMKNWFTGLVPIMLTGFPGIRKPSDVLFESIAGIPLPILKKYHPISYESYICYFDMKRFPRYKIGFGNWEVATTPGHTEDSVSFFNEDTRELICGDLILGRNDGTGYLNPFHNDRKTIVNTFKTVNNIAPLVIYPSHGEIIRHSLNAMVKVQNL